MWTSRLYGLFLVLVSGLTPADAWQSKGYAAADIPASLTNNAGAVYRESFQRVTISGPGAMTIKKRDVVTILRESGIDEATLTVGYNKIVKVSSVSGTVYNAAGDKVRNIRQDEIEDYSAFDGFSIYSDSRIKRINPKYYNYPFTVEYEYEVSVKTALYLPSFQVFQGYETSVEKARYELITPAGFKIHYLEQNGMTQCSEMKAGKNVVYSWSYENFPAKIAEQFAPDPSERYPYVLIAPDGFSIEGYAGRNDSWESFGRFISSLNSGKQNLPENTVRTIKELISGLGSNEEIIKAVYSYSQKRNRYVSIQVGIGGIEPFDAATVDRYSYGDCKALSNYVMSLLKVAGIESYYTLVYAGDRSIPVVKDFVQDYFNHVILCVPNDGDTIWLECTNPFAPANYLGSFTDDRYVLLITDSGGRLVKTPGYSKSQNSVSVRSNVHLTGSGHAMVIQNSVHKGTGFGEQLSMRSIDEKDREKAILRSIPLPDISVKSYDFGISPENPVALNKRIEFEANNCVTITGNIMMIKQGLVSGSLPVPPVARRRENTVEIRRNFMRTDSTTFLIPPGYEAGSIPADVTYSNEMAECSYQYHQGDNQFIIIRRFSVNKGNYPAEKYNELRTFFENCAARDDERIVLKRVEPLN